MGTYPQNGGKPVFNEFITPIGLLVHSYHDKPQMKTDDRTKQPIVDKDGVQEGEWKVTLAWSKTRQAELQEMINLAYKTQGEAWPNSLNPGAFFHLEPFFRDGDNPAHNTKGRDYLFGRYYMNFKSKAPPVRDAQTGRISYTGQPGLLGPYGPEDKILPVDLYPGCTARVSGIMFGSEYMGKNFISVRLNNIQKADDGERIGGGGRPDAASQFGAIKQAQAMQGMQPGFGGFGGPAGGSMAGGAGNGFPSLGGGQAQPSQNQFNTNAFGQPGGRTVI